MIKQNTALCELTIYNYYIMKSPQFSTQQTLVKMMQCKIHTVIKALKADNWVNCPWQYTVLQILHWARETF